MFVSLFFVSSLAVCPSGWAQDENENTSDSEDELSETAPSVSRQKGCSLMIKNGEGLEPQQKVELRHSSGLKGIARVNSVKPDGVALAVLSKKLCKKSFVGASVATTKASGASSATMQDVGGSAKRKNVNTAAAEREPSTPVLPMGVVPDSSAHHRMTKPFSARIGAGLMFTPGYTFGVGYNFSHEFAIEGTLDFASANLLNIFKYDRTRIGVLANYFTGNSSYLSGGMVFEQFSTSLSAPKVTSDGISLSPDSFKGSFSQIQLQLGIGHRWNLGAVFIGTEWLGYSQSITTLSEEFSIADGYDDAQIDKNSNRNFANSGSLRLFNTFIGISI